MPRGSDRPPLADCVVLPTMTTTASRAKFTAGYLAAIARDERDDAKRASPAETPHFLCVTSRAR